MTSHDHTRQSATPLLDVNDVSVTFHTPSAVAPAANKVSFDLSRGETLGLVGESGSGKSTVGRAVLGLVSPSEATVAGSVRFDGCEVLVTSVLNGAERRRREASNRRLWGDRSALIPQKLNTPANPVQRIGNQLVEQIRTHRPDVTRADARSQANEQLRQVGLADWFDAYPHELSGGMIQRFWIAMALANSPKLIVADESTTALDVVRQREFMTALVGHQRTRGLGVLLISHDLALVEEFANRVVVMYAGRVVETGPTDAVFRSPRHPYTAGLLATLLRLGGSRKPSFPVIRGEPLKITALPLVGCHFAPRCPHATDRCGQETPELRRETASRFDRCLRRNEWRKESPPPVSPTGDCTGAPVATSAPDEVVRVDDLRMEFATTRGQRLWARSSKPVLKGVSLRIGRGETVALIGKSGCGKSTLARLIAGLLVPTAGTITVNGAVAMVFQEPGASLNPLTCIGDAVAAPMRWSGWSRRDARRRAAELLDNVGLAEMADRLPASLSGGQQQRAAIARALAVEPALLILDEAVTNLDCSIRGQILNLLREINRRRQIAYLFITHDLTVARHFSDRLLIMSDGKLDDGGQSAEYQELVNALPRYQNGRVKVNSTTG